MFEALVRLCRQLEPDGVMIVVRRRRDVLDENRNRLAFMTNNLERYSKPHVIEKKKSPRAALNASR